MSKTASRPPATQAGYAYGALRRAIITGQLSAGEHVYQAEWAESLAISVTPVREAIRRLEQDGLVRSIPHRGVTVIGLELAQAEEIYAMRLAVEPLQIQRSIGKMTDADHANARSLCERMARTEDVIEFTELNEQFHRITMVLDDSWTSRVIKMLTSAAAPYVSFSLRRAPELMQNSNADHYALLEAFWAKDLEESIRLETQHLQSTLEVLRTTGI